MPNGKFISYYRVSTHKQGQSGLGLDAQRQAVTEYLNGGEWQLLGEFVEIESGKRSDRPELEKAIVAARKQGAVLLVAKLDRLARNAAFLLSLRDAGVEFVACDMPDANRLTVGIMALVAEDEAERISQRTKVALAAAKARGTKLGHPNPIVLAKKGRNAQANNADKHASKVVPVIEEIRAAGLTGLGKIAEALNARGIATARGGRWYATTVKNVLERQAAMQEGLPGEVQSTG